MYRRLSPFPLVCTFSVFRSFLLALSVTVFSAGSLSSHPQTENAHSFTPGTATAQVVALQNPQQSYVLYLPTKYSPDQRWPIVYVFDPLARGPLALAPFQQAAETHGYIVAVSNNSRNGPWQPEFEAAEAMVRDTQQRFTVDLKRIYFAGFSGGARVASQLASALQMRCGSPVKRRWVFSRLITFSGVEVSRFLCCW